MVSRVKNKPIKPRRKRPKKRTSFEESVVITAGKKAGKSMRPKRRSSPKIADPPAPTPKRKKIRRRSNG